MERKLAGLFGIAAAALALGLGSAVEAGHADSPGTGRLVQADIQGPTASHPGAPGPTAVQADIQGPTVSPADIQGPTAVRADIQGPTVPPAGTRGATAVQADIQGPTVSPADVKAKVFRV